MKPSLFSWFITTMKPSGVMVPTTPVKYTLKGCSCSNPRLKGVWRKSRCSGESGDYGLLNTLIGVPPGTQGDVKELIGVPPGTQGDVKELIGVPPGTQGDVKELRERWPIYSVLPSQHVARIS